MTSHVSLDSWSRTALAACSIFWTDDARLPGRLVSEMTRSSSASGERRRSAASGPVNPGKVVVRRVSAASSTCRHSVPLALWPSWKSLSRSRMARTRRSVPSARSA
jgi:hypothetical protein